MTEETVSREVAGAANELRLSMMRLVRRLRAERPPHGLSLTRIDALGRLDRDGPATVTELAAAEGITPQSMARAMAELVESGLVTRQSDPHDGRQVLLAIAADGEALLAEDRARRSTWLAVTMADRLSPEERDVLRIAGRLLDRLAEA